MNEYIHINNLFFPLNQVSIEFGNQKTYTEANSSVPFANIRSLSDGESIGVFYGKDAGALRDALKGFTNAELGEFDKLENYTSPPRAEEKASDAVLALVAAQSLDTPYTRAQLAPFSASELLEIKQLTFEALQRLIEPIARKIPVDMTYLEPGNNLLGGFEITTSYSTHIKYQGESVFWNGDEPDFILGEWAKKLKARGENIARLADIARARQSETQKENVIKELTGGSK